MKKKGEKDIDLIDVFNVVIKSKKKILRIVAVFFAFGLFVAVFSQKTYKSSAVFVPQTESSKMKGSLGSIASAIGVSIGQGSTDESLSPVLFSKIINTISFKKKMIETKLSVKGFENKVSYKNYFKKIYKPSLLGYIKKYTIGLPSLIFGKKEDSLTKKKHNNNFEFYSFEEEKLFENIGNSVSLDYYEDENYVKIIAYMPEPIQAAELVSSVQKVLEDEVTRLKIKKSKIHLDFLKERFNEVKIKYKKISLERAIFQDRNQMSVTLKSKIKLDQINSEYSLIYSVYSELSKQLEGQRIKVKEDMPVFMTIQKPMIPIKKAGPKRLIILLSFTFIGFFIALTIVLLKKYTFNII